LESPGALRGFILGFFQMALEKGKVRAIEDALRALAKAATEPANEP
jgi:hypothetical protein